MNDWYHSVGGKQQGPVTHREMERLVSSGELKKETLIWKDGMENWKPAGDVLPDLFNTGESTPPLPGSMPSVPASSSPTTSGAGSTAVNWAIGSVVSSSLGLVSCMCCIFVPFSIAGVVFGHISLSRLKGITNQQSTKVVAIIGLVLGYLGLLFLVLGFVLGFAGSLADPEFLEEFQRTLEEAQQQ